jgi:hypothetical protein
MTRGADIEERWINLWSAMFDALDRDPHLVIVGEDWRPISFEDCQGLVQDAVYDGHQPRFETTWFQGRQVLQVFLTSTSKS